MIVRPLLMSTYTASSMPVAGEAAAENEVQGMKLLSGKDDYYGGIIVDMDEPMKPSAFVSILRASISNWKAQVL